MRRMSLIIFMFAISSNILFAFLGNWWGNWWENIGSQLKTYSYVCYEKIGQGYHYSQGITRYSYEYCLNDEDFNKSSRFDAKSNMYLPKSGVSGIKWHHCEDKVFGTAWGKNEGNGKVRYTYSGFLNAFVPCWYTGKAPYFPPPPPPPLPQKTESKLVFVEKINNKDGEINKIYTGISGDQKTIKITSDNSNEKLNNIQCKFKDMQNNGESSIKQVVNMGKNSYMAVLSPPKSGYYTFYCTGVNDKKESIESQKVEFFAAPAAYNVDMRIDTAYTNVSVNSDFIKTGAGSGSFNSSKDTHLKLSDQAKITINSKVTTANGKPDTGINTSLKAYKIEFKNNSATCPVSQIMTSDTSKSLIKFNNGQAMVSSKNISEVHGISFSDVGYGELKIAYKDEDTDNLIKQEKAKGNCDNGLVACPYAPVIEFNLKTRVFPDNYKVELVDGSNPIKVLYYGQGNDPKLDSSNNIKVTAIDSKDNPLKNNIANCAAQDINLDMKFANNNAGIKLLNKDGSEGKTLLSRDFKTNSTASKDTILSVRKNNGDMFLPNEVNNPVFTKFEASLEYSGKGNDNSYPKYANPKLNNTDLALLRARINLIDADNASDFSKMPTTKIIYEFYCQSCDLNKLSNITGVTKYENSPTAYNWYIDASFSKFNKSKVDVNNITTDNGIKVSSASAINNGVQMINYNNASKGQYQVKVKQDSRASNSFPSYLLYNRYYDGTSSSLSNITSWGTSAKVLVYEKLGNDNRNYGLDTGNAKNTRGANRIGGF